MYCSIDVRQGLTDNITQTILSQELTQTKQGFEARNEIHAKNVKTMLNNQYKDTVVHQVGKTLKITLPERLVSIYNAHYNKPTKKVSKTTLDPDADDYILDNFMLSFDRLGPTFRLTSFHPDKVEQITDVMNHKRKAGYTVKSTQPSQFWDTLVAMERAELIDGTYYYVGGTVSQTDFDNHYTNPMYGIEGSIEPTFELPPFTEEQLALCQNG